MKLQLEKIKRLPQRKETWQGGLTRIPMWTQDDQQQPYRPWIAGWIGLKNHRFHTTNPDTRENLGFDTALDELFHYINDEHIGYRPTKIEVKDPMLADYLIEELAGTNISVETRDKLFIFEEKLSDFTEFIEGRPPLPGALDPKGVTVDSMRAFAEAAAEFYNAALCKHLMPEDLIEVKSPFVDKLLRYFTVLGNGGMTFGIGFYESPDQLKDMFEHPEPTIELLGKHWSVLFGPIDEIPFSDVDLWEDHNLPVADQQAYPLAICTGAGHKVLRPGPDILAFLEGLLRSLAKTKESDLDNEIWEKNVSTFKADIKFSLALVPWDQDSSQTVHTDKHIPDLRSMEAQTAALHRAIEEQDFDNIDEINEFIKTKFQDGRFQSAKPKTDLEKAQDLAYQAFDAFGRKQLQLARKALEICPDCADAYVVLAEREVDLDKTYELYKKGVDTGRRALGDKYFEENTGSFWSLIKTRPFMRALLGLAQCCECMDLEQETLDYYNELLRLNPNDNQGVRDSLLCFLLDLGENKNAEKLLKRYKNDNIFALWCYSRALITFRQKGDTAAARKHLQKALKVNPIVPGYLLDPELLSDFGPESFSLGSREEAIICAEKLEYPWYDTPGAIEWLESHTDFGSL